MLKILHVASFAITSILALTSAQAQVYQIDISASVDQQALTTAAIPSAVGLQAILSALPAGGELQLVAANAAAEVFIQHGATIYFPPEKTLSGVGYQGSKFRITARNVSGSSFRQNPPFMITGTSATNNKNAKLLNLRLEYDNPVTPSQCARSNGVNGVVDKEMIFAIHCSSLEIRGCEIISTRRGISLDTCKNSSIENCMIIIHQRTPLPCSSNPTQICCRHDDSTTNCHSCAQGDRHIGGYGIWCRGGSGNNFGHNHLYGFDIAAGFSWNSIPLASCCHDPFRHPSYFNTPISCIGGDMPLDLIAVYGGIQHNIHHNTIAGANAAGIFCSLDLGTNSRGIGHHIHHNNVGKVRQNGLDLAHQDDLTIENNVVQEVELSCMLLANCARPIAMANQFSAARFTSNQSINCFSYWNSYDHRGSAVIMLEQNTHDASIEGNAVSACALTPGHQRPAYTYGVWCRAGIAPANNTIRDNIEWLGFVGLVGYWECAPGTALIYSNVDLPIACF